MNTGLPGPLFSFLFLKILDFFVLFWGGRGQIFSTLSSNPFIEFLISTFSKIFCSRFLFIVSDFHIFSCVSEDINGSKWHRDLRQQGPSAYLENKIPAVGGGCVEGAGREGAFCGGGVRKKEGRRCRR